MQNDLMSIGIDMSEYTKEPWPDFVDVATTMTPDPEGPLAAILSPEDYMRAKACVDACEGVPQDWLESGLSGCVQNVRDERDMYLDRSIKITQQRDELLEMLKQIVAHPEIRSTLIGDEAGILIEKVEGNV
jgi:hypothetical protein